MKKVYLLFPFLALGLAGVSQMTIQSGATLYIENGAKVTIQGDLTSAANIQGAGTVLMKGTALQTINMNGNTIPNLEIDNPANVTLAGSFAKIGNGLVFTNGKLLTSSQDLVIGATATISGQNSSRFIWTDGAGQVRKELAGDIVNYEVPVGFNDKYRPAYITSTGATYAGANIGVRSLDAASANRPPMMANFLNTTWPVTKTGITGGTQTIAGQYVEGSDVNGTETALVGYYFNGTDWSSQGHSKDYAANRISMALTAASGELTAMNSFVAVGARAFLQGAYNSATGLMNDGLRVGGNVIPVNDPYRTAPYNTSFSHVANTTAEIVSASVFNDQASANDNIVDWVFLELRNTASPGNTVLQTRSALIQRDGDIVDVDGVSPVTFNSVADGNYTIAVRHRNHLGLATLPTSPRTFSERKSVAFSTNVADLRNSATALFGSSILNYAIAAHPNLGNVNLLWAGNANANANVRYTGLNNDKDYILLTVLDNNASSVLTNVYNSADINLNKVVRYNGLNNDKDFLYINILESNTVTVRSQALPN
ncbi:MAG TPA: hypothetical protein VMR70_10035 [Flavisolibacter sp.]|nr:hypothetical protein [Flavisolibacter sp.]